VGLQRQSGRAGHEGPKRTKYHVGGGGPDCGGEGTRRQSVEGNGTAHHPEIGNMVQATQDAPTFVGDRRCGNGCGQEHGHCLHAESGPGVFGTKKTTPIHRTGASCDPFQDAESDRMPATPPRGIGNPTWVQRLRENDRRKPGKGVKEKDAETTAKKIALDVDSQQPGGPQRCRRKKETVNTPAR